MKLAMFLTFALTATVLAAESGSAGNNEYPGLYFERCGRCHGTAEALFERNARPVVPHVNRHRAGSGDLAVDP